MFTVYYTLLIIFDTTWSHSDDKQDRLKNATTWIAWLSSYITNKQIVTLYNIVTIDRPNVSE